MGTTKGEDLFSLIQRLHAAQRHRWLNGERVLIEVVLSDHPELFSQHEPLLELIYGEICLRESFGESPQLQEYIRRFPQIRDQLELQFEMHRGLSPTLHTSVTDESPGLKSTISMRQVGKFELLERVGMGSFGEVWRARDPELDRPVALKIPHTNLVQSPADLERFYREARAAAQLRHPGIVTVHEVVTLDGTPAIVSDYIEGVTLRDYMKFRSLTFEESARLVAQVAEALDYAHSILVHRDIKPANIMLECRSEQDTDSHRSSAAEAPPSGRGPNLRREMSSTRRLRPLIMDFGLALRADAETTLTIDGQLIGTPAYMSPEQAKGRAHRVDRRGDIYSLGVVLYELLCRELPFHGNRQAMIYQVLNEEPRRPRDLNNKVPRDLETICLKAMAKEPGSRYLTARAMADDLHRFLSGEPIRARPLTSVERIFHWCRRNVAHASLIGLVIVLVVLMAVVATRPLVAGLAVAVATTLVLMAGVATAAALRLSRMAVKEHDARSDAEANLLRARSAVDEMLTQVADQWLNNVPQMESVRQALLHKALGFYEQFLDDRPSSPHLRSEAARARRRVADIHTMLGQHRQAREAYQAAINSLKELTLQFPGEPTYRHHLGITYDYLGELLRTTGTDLDEAERLYRLALDVQADLVDQFPDSVDYQQELSRTYNNFGILRMDTARPIEAEQSFRMAVKLLTNLVERAGSVAAYQEELARTYINLGVVLNRNSQVVSDARTAFQQAVSLLERIVAANPVSRDSRYKLAVSQLDLGNLLLARLADAAEAEKHYRRAVGILEQLASDFPSVLVYREELAISCNSLGGALAITGRLGEAEQFQRQAANLFEKMAAQFPAVPRYQSLLAISLGGQAWLANQNGDTASARRLVESAITHQQLATEANPDNSEYRSWLSEHWAFLAEILVQQANHDRAVECLQQAVDLGFRGGRKLPTLSFDPLRAREDFRQLLAAINPERSS